MRTLPILGVQSAPVSYDVAATWRKFETEIRELRGRFEATRLFLYPELYLAASGPAAVPRPASDSPATIAEPIPGPLTDRLSSLAVELDAWLVPGSFYERGEDGEVYNTAVAIAPDGTLRARYRKIFPWRPWEHSAAGDEFVVFDVDGVGRVGLMICYDGWYPEVARQLAWLGAEVILQPSATITSDREQEIVLARANAIANQVFVVNVNVGGGSVPGRSIIVDPEGHVLQQAGSGEEYLTEVLDLDAVTRVREYGSVALNRMWEQLDREGPGIELPMYGGRIRPRPTSSAPAESGPGIRLPEHELVG